MTNAIKAKLYKPDTPKNVCPICVLLEDPEYSRSMLGRLKKGGSVALTDFEEFGPAARMEGVERHGIHR